MVVHAQVHILHRTLVSFALCQKTHGGLLEYCCNYMFCNNFVPVIICPRLFADVVVDDVVIYFDR